MNTSHSKKIRIYVKTSQKDFFTKHADKIKELASVKEIIINNPDIEVQAISISFNFAEIKIPLEELSNIKDLIIKLENEVETLENRIEKNKKMLENKNFLEKAPENVIEKIKVSIEQDDIKFKKAHSNLIQLKRSL